MQSDKLKQLKFTYKYNYPTLIWASSSRSETPLYYYILEKCGIEKHHLEYLEQSYFIENYPVFSTIFNGNNPVRNLVKNFWGSDKTASSTRFQNNLLEARRFAARAMR